MEIHPSTKNDMQGGSLQNLSAIELAGRDVATDLATGLSAATDATTALANAATALSAAKATTPKFTYTASTIGNGLFTTNNAAPASTTTITLSSANLLGHNSIAAILLALGTGFLPRIILTSILGDTNVFSITSIVSSGGNAALTVSNVVSGAAAWSGQYGISFMTDLGTGPTITQVQAASSITPAADNTYANPTSITIVKGIITAIS